MEYTLQELASQVNAQIHGDPDCVISAVATLDKATDGDISFLTNTTYLSQLKTTQASAVILSEEFVEQCPVNALITGNPHGAYAQIATLLYPYNDFTPLIHPSAVIDASAQIDSSCYIGPHVVIEADVRLGKRCHIGANSFIGKGVQLGDDGHCLANVIICHDVKIGQRVLLHSGAVIGSDGFGQARLDNGDWLRVPQLGSVVMGDDVEIGANTTIDRGAIGDTIIEDGVKLDNLIQIAHNVRIGAHTVMAGTAAIAGSTKIGKHCMIGGAVGIVGHLTIADNVMITAMSFVTKSIERPGKYSSGMPADENSKWLRRSAHLRQIDVMERRIRQLEKHSGIKKN